MIKRFSFIWLLISVFACAGTKDARETAIKAEGAELFCRTLGKGKPLIILHGGPGLTQDYLLPYMDRLAENHFVIFYDQRGCGKSTGEINQDTITIETFVKDIEAIRKAFHFDKISLLGHSWGGLLAMQYAIAHPDSVDKLILSNTMPASSEGLTLFVQEFTRRMAPFHDELAEIHSSAGYHEGNPDLMERLYRTIFRRYCHLSEKAELLNLRMPALASVNGANVYKYIHQNVYQKKYDLHVALKNLRIPTLVVHGDADPIPFIAAKRIHESINGSQFILMKNCGHFPYIEDPDAYFSYLDNFLHEDQTIPAR